MFLIEPDGTELPLKDAGTGESVHSLLSLMDAIIGQCGSTHEYSSISSIHVHVGQPHPFRTVAARAIRDTYVLQ